MAEFAMVEELAFLIKDNLSCKHLVLSLEEVLVDILKQSTSLDGVLELEPMSPYQRMLLHRLADIYGFAHESVGEGDDRHLILERCSESSIPPVLISDILWDYDDCQSPKESHLILTRKEISPASKTNQTLPPSVPLEERQAAYQAARERIFSLHDGNLQELGPPKPRNIPVVARRMIAHALGKNISSPPNEKPSHPKSPEYVGASEEFINNEALPDSNLEAARDSSLNERKIHSKKSAGKSSIGSRALQTESNVRVVSKENSVDRSEAAKRIFAQALGLPSTKQNHGPLLNCKQKSRNNQGVGFKLAT